MAGDGLFGELPNQDGPRRVAGEARLREPQRDQVELRAMDIESLIGADHPARTIWAYVEGLDLRELGGCGFMRPVKEWVAHEPWIVSASAMTPIVGCAVGCR